MTDFDMKLPGPVLTFKLLDGLKRTACRCRNNLFQWFSKKCDKKTVKNYLPVFL